ncbi:hypothetical protein QAD02_008342 [Eretmocerus hayati]|uniref:Uncharacterized protein n=1 Tax=Eretmocerus hayati TaxID=131215 RepID=A0ACC2N663_9HYME|nr:hypothetical protein QAD02_008342 [Eretmocerus hayati]
MVLYLCVFQVLSFNHDEEDTRNAVNKGKSTCESSEIGDGLGWNSGLYQIRGAKLHRSEYKLAELFDDDEWNEPISVSLQATKAGMFLAMLKLSLKDNFTLTATAEMLKMFNSFFVRSFFPDSTYFLEEYFLSIMGVDVTLLTLYPPRGNEFHAGALLNNDQAPAFESSKFSLMPYQFVMNELAQDVRVINPITCRLYFGKDKPNGNFSTRAFVDNANKVSEEGIECNINNKIVNVKLCTFFAPVWIPFLVLQRKVSSSTMEAVVAAGV